MLQDFFKVVKGRLGEETGSHVKSSLSIPNDILFKCIRCSHVAFKEEFIKEKHVCPSCGYHARLSAEERIEMTVDADSFTLMDDSLMSKNPIGFKGYEQKLGELKDKTGLNDALVTGECTIHGESAVIAIMDSRFMMASMGSVVGERLTRAFELATRKRLPVIVFTASGGARMQEGIVSLMQMAKTSAAVARHSEAGLLYITVLTDPTTGGVTASFASLGDIILAEPKALIGFAGRRVIEDTIKQRLPDEFQSAEFMQEHGFVDMIVTRINMRRTLSGLIKLNKTPHDAGTEKEG